MQLSIHKVITNKELRKFVNFPNQLYKNNPYYVPQLVKADLDALTPGKNHAFEVCEGAYWLAYNGNEIVGRVAGIINHAYNKQMGEIYVRFGWIDFIDNAEVVDLLISTVESWTAEYNAKYICGPVGFLEFDAAGIVVEGFDQLPTAYGKYNAPYYAQHLERLGYAKEIDWVEYNIKIPEIMPDAISRGAQLLSEKYQCHIVEFKSKKQLLEYSDQIFALMNKQYSRIHGYTQLTSGQIEDLKKQFLPLLNLNFVTAVADMNDKIIAFSICAPSMAKALQKAKGHLFPFGFIHILRALRHNDTIDTLLIAVDDEYQKKGITALMFNHLGQKFHKYGYTTIESTRQLENNWSVRNLGQRFEYQLHKRARSFIKTIR